MALAVRLLHDNAAVRCGFLTCQFSSITHAGKVPNGLKWHPDGNHIVYPLGSTVVIKNLSDGKQSFLTGHTDLVTTVALSKCGKYIASGQKTNMGFKVCRLATALQ